MKVGRVVLIGRPNVGKSTLLNNILQQKVSITSPLPQTTKFSIQAIYEDERGQILFTDTPGIFAKSPNPQSRFLNHEAEKATEDKIDVVLYMIDCSRDRGNEENRVLGIVRKIEDIPKILVINKIDIKDKNYREQYRFIEDEVNDVVEISAIKGKNISVLLEKIFGYLKEGEKIVNREDLSFPALNMSSNLYIEEIIREKCFLVLREELPYFIKVTVEEVTERKGNLTYIKARITAAKRYKKMIIGAGGARIKEIGSMARREFELSTGRRIYLDLRVEAE